MTGFRRRLVLLLIFCLFFIPPVLAVDEGCVEKVEQLQKKNQDLSRQLRDARRELALEKSSEEQPGIPEVLAGVGVIFGLFGVVALVRSKKA